MKLLKPSFYEKISWQIGEHKSNNIKNVWKQWKYAPLFPPPPTQLMNENSAREFEYHTLIPYTPGRVNTSKKTSESDSSQSHPSE